MYVNMYNCILQNTIQSTIAFLITSIVSCYKNHLLVFVTAIFTNYLFVLDNWYLRGRGGCGACILIPVVPVLIVVPIVLRACILGVGPGILRACILVVVPAILLIIPIILISAIDLVIIIVLRIIVLDWEVIILWVRRNYGVIIGRGAITGRGVPRFRWGGGWCNISVSGMSS